MNINQKGCFAEYKFATMAMERGFNVSMPLLDASTYDCILEKDGVLFKVQIKYVSAKRIKDTKYDNVKVILIQGNSSPYPKHLCDYFAVWLDEGNGFFIVPNTEQTSLRLSLTNKYSSNFNNFDIIS